MRPPVSADDHRRELRDLRILQFQREIVSCSGDLAGLLDCVLTCAERLVDADGATIEVLEGNEMVYEAGSGIAASFVGLRLNVDRSLSGRCLKENQAMLCADTETDVRVDREACRRIKVRSMVLVPIPYNEKTLGVLKVMSREPNAFGSGHLEEIELSAGLVGATIERKRAELALRETSDRFRALADNIPQLAWMTNSTGWIDWYNQRWYDFTGTTLDEMQGWGWTKVHHPDFIERVTAKWQRALDAGDTWEDTFPLRRFDGEYRWFLSRAVPIRNGEGVIVSWFGTNTDITEQRQVEEQLRIARDEAEAASKAKDVFVATISHELRTPLSPALLITGDLMEDKRLSDDVRDHLATVHRAITLESRLIDDLLDLSRMTQGKLTMHFGVYDAHGLIHYALEIVEADRDAHDIRIITSLAAENSLIHADSARIQQVLWNVLKNAIKFTEPGGTIEVSTRNDPSGQLIVEIKDNGRGIEPEMKEAIFRPFVQAGLENDHRFGGLGLGLAICRAVMSMHGGTIHALSEGRGKGSLFRITLNSVPSLPGDECAAGRPEGVAAAASTAPGEESAHLLLVEDHQPTLAVLARLLSRRGYKVVCANSFATGLAAARQAEFDVLISDIGLPDGNGNVLLPEIRRQQPWIQGIALTGYGSEEDRGKTTEAGFLTHLTKPVDFGELHRALIAALDRRHSSRLSSGAVSP